MSSTADARALPWLVAGYAGATVSEWAVWLAVLVETQQRAGSAAAGWVALGLLSPAVLGAPVGGAHVRRCASHPCPRGRLRRAGGRGGRRVGRDGDRCAAGAGARAGRARDGAASPSCARRSRRSAPVSCRALASSPRRASSAGTATAPRCSSGRSWPPSCCRGGARRRCSSPRRAWPIVGLVAAVRLLPLDRLTPAARRPRAPVRRRRAALGRPSAPRSCAAGGAGLRCTS